MTYVKVEIDKRTLKRSMIHRNYLKQYMSENGITIAKLVEISDISETAIKNIREHRQEPLKTTMHLICKALDVDVCCLFPEFEIVGVSLKRKCLQQVS